ncbi:MAG TPA: TonB-dependent receptor [Flavobacteriaceae bacterium]|nr:TonB-dependent receptor [Flavobacteriaceae bacterium]
MKKSTITIPLLLLFSFFFSLSVYAQSQIEVTGKVLDASSRSPLEFTTVIFIDSEDTMVSGGITNQNGEFNIKVPAGTYTVRYEFLSFKTKDIENQVISKGNRELAPVYLEEDSAVLNEVVIRAETTEVQINLDKKVYNIGKDLTTSGATISDVLDNVPSVSVDVEGAISLRGNDNVRILINGKPSALAGFDSTDALRQLPSEAIESVEVITSPSARYDAEGTAGIINIILRQENTLGINGSVRLNAGDPLNAGVTGSINLRTKKFNIFNNTGYDFRESTGSSYSNNHYLNPNRETPFVNEIGEDLRWRRGFNTHLGVEYFINDQSSLTAAGFLRFGNNDSRSTNLTDEFDPNHILQKSRTREENSKNKDNNVQFSLNYENRLDNEGQKLTADFQYDRSKRDGLSFIDEFNTLPSELLPGEQIWDVNTRNNFLAQVDYVLPIGDRQFEAGYRGDFNNSKTDYQVDDQASPGGDYVLNTDLSNIFDYTQNTHALYSQYGERFGKLSVLLGLRLEATKLKGEIDGEADVSDVDYNIYDFDKDYVGLFPTANLTYELDDMQSFSLGYNRRINRPRRWFINPFPSRSSESNIFQGNPALDPAYSNTFDLGYLKRWEKFTFNTSVYYQVEDDSFQVISEDTGEITSNGIPIIRAIPINLATNKRLGFEASFMYNPERWLRFNGSFNVFTFRTTGEFNGIDYGAKDNSWFTRFSSKVTLPGKIDWQTNAFYRGARKTSQTETDGIFSLDMALSKDVFNGNGTLGVNVRDLLDTRKRKSYTVTDTFIRDSERQWMPRSINVSLTYRFNQSKQDMQRNNRRQNGENGDFEEQGAF